jgi:hypothetical protein
VQQAETDRIRERELVIKKKEERRKKYSYIDVNLSDSLTFANTDQISCYYNSWDIANIAMALHFDGK